MGATKSQPMRLDPPPHPPLLRAKHHIHNYTNTIYDKNYTVLYPQKNKSICQRLRSFFKCANI